MRKAKGSEDLEEQGQQLLDHMKQKASELSPEGQAGF